MRSAWTPHRPHRADRSQPARRNSALIGVFDDLTPVGQMLLQQHRPHREVEQEDGEPPDYVATVTAAVRARIIPASPCGGIRVSSGEYAPDRLVASPVQALRAAMRLYEAGSWSGWIHPLRGRHIHATWLTEDGVPEVARRARLGQKMKGIARIYDHVTDVMRKQTLDALEARWDASLLALTATKRARLVGWFPHLEPVISRLMIENRDGKKDAVPHLAPTQD